MSRVGLKPIPVPGGVTVKIDGKKFTAKGPKGELSWTMPEEITAKEDGGTLVLSRANELKQSKALHGTSRSLLANMVHGVSEGYTRELEIIGVGFKAQVQGQKLVIQAGFSHPIEIDVPEGLSAEVKGETISVTGTDKQAVGALASRIRTSWPAEPYKGKGIKYKGEQIRRKAGKTVA